MMGSVVKPFVCGDTLRSIIRVQSILLDSPLVVTRQMEHTLLMSSLLNASLGLEASATFRSR